MAVAGEGRASRPQCPKASGPLAWREIMTPVLHQFQFLHYNEKARGEAAIGGWR